MYSPYFIVTEDGMQIKQEVSSQDFQVVPEAQGGPTEAVQESHVWGLQGPAAHGSMLQYVPWEEGHLSQNGSQDLGAERDRVLATSGMLPSSTLPLASSMQLPCRLMIGRQGVMAEEGVATYPAFSMDDAGTGHMIKIEPMFDDDYPTPPQPPLLHPALGSLETRDSDTQDPQDSDEVADWEVDRREWKRNRSYLYSIITNIFRCSHCSKEYRSSEQLKTHMLTKHQRLEGEESTTRRKNTGCSPSQEDVGHARCGRTSRKLTVGREMHGISSTEEEVDLNNWIIKCRGKYKCKECLKKFVYGGAARRHVRISHYPGTSARTSQGMALRRRVLPQATHSKDTRVRRGGQNSSRELPSKRALRKDATVRREGMNSREEFSPESVPNEDTSPTRHGMDSSEFSSLGAHSKRVRIRHGGENSSGELTPKRAQRKDATVGREGMSSREEFSPESVPNEDTSPRRHGMDSSEFSSLGAHSNHVGIRHGGENSSGELTPKRAQRKDATVGREEISSWEEFSPASLPNEDTSPRRHGMDSSGEFSQGAHSKHVGIRHGGENSSGEFTPKRAQCKDATVGREEMNSREDFSPARLPNEDTSAGREGMDSSDVFSFQEAHSRDANPRREGVNCSRVFFPVSLQRIERDKFDCPECRATFALAEHLKRHMDRNHPGQDQHACPQCEAFFTEVSHLQHHINQEHKRLGSICMPCDIVFASEAELESHNQSFHRRCLKKTCQVCGKTFGRLLELKLHMTMEHGNLQNKPAAQGSSGSPGAMQPQPGVSEERATTQAAAAPLERQAEACEDQEQDYLCPHCDKSFTGEGLWRLHQKVVHGCSPSQNSSQNCSQNSSQNSSQNCSQNTSQNCSQNTSQNCSQNSSQDPHRKATNSSVIATLLSRQGVPAGLGCPHCPERFRSSKSLARHLFVHKEPKYKCSKCGESFHKRSLLTKHMAQAHQEGKCVCPECGKGYSRKDHLKEHIDSVHKGFAIKCDTCGKTFTRNHHLNRHIKKHHSEQPGTSCSEFPGAL